MKKIIITVSFPQTFEYEIDESISVEENRENIKNYASYLMESSPCEPVIIECSDKILVE